MAITKFLQTLVREIPCLVDTSQSFNIMGDFNVDSFDRCVHVFPKQGSGLPQNTPITACGL